MGETKTKGAKKGAASKAKRWKRRAKGGGSKTCAVDKCARPYRAKGYCYFHFKKWRHGELPHSRYRTCKKSDCRKKVFKSSLCETHWGELNKTKEAAAAAA